MTNDALIARATAMRIANARAKRSIQAKRSRDAKTIATAHIIHHTGNFPTDYKYG